MADFVGFDPKRGTRFTVDFAGFIDIIKGATVRSCAAGEDFVELGLAEQINVRFGVTNDGGMQVSLVSTLNDNDIPPLRVRILEDDEPAPASLVEARIRQLRQSYAISYMVQSGRAGELKSAVIKNPRLDLEQHFLHSDEQLRIAAAAPGSFWVTVITKSVKAYEVVKLSLALPYKEGRRALLRRIEAETELKELAVEDKKLDVGLKRIKGAITTVNDIEKIKDPDIRAALKGAFISSLDGEGAKEVLSLPSLSKKLPRE